MGMHHQWALRRKLSGMINFIIDEVLEKKGSQSVAFNSLILMMVTQLADRLSCTFSNQAGLE